MFVRLLVIVLVAALVWAIAARSSDGAGPSRAYVVKPYDTLWSIAVAHYDGDPREAVWELQRRNGLDDTLLRPGQRLVLP